VAEFRPATPDQAEFLAELTGAGLLIDSGAPGVYGRGPVFEGALRGFEALVSRFAEPDGSEALRFPPVLPRRHFESSGYLKSFPHLAGTVFSFEGSESEAAEQRERAARHEDWSEFQKMTDLVLVPAACYPVYPAIAARGQLPDGGVTVDLGGTYVFRREPSGDPARMQMFHQREMVRLGDPDAVMSWRESWMERAVELVRRVGLDAELDVATDPFFGRAGRMLAANFNYHQDHFADVFGIRTADDELAHTACLGFGLERITLGLFRAHGLDPERWPADVRSELGV